MIRHVFLLIRKFDTGWAVGRNFHAASGVVVGCTESRTDSPLGWAVIDALWMALIATIVAPFSLPFFAALALPAFTVSWTFETR